MENIIKFAKDSTELSIAFQLKIVNLCQTKGAILPWKRTWPFVSFPKTPSQHHVPCTSWVAKGTTHHLVAAFAAEFDGSATLRRAVYR